MNRDHVVDDPAPAETEAERRLPGGAIVWYDLRVNNPHNRDVRGVGAAEIRAIFPGCRISLGSAILAPPIARRLARFSWPLCGLLAAIPPARIHYLAIIRPGSA
jgi:hypothetical protein